MFNPESSKHFKDTWGAVLPPEKKAGVNIPGPESAANDDASTEDLTHLAEEVPLPTPRAGSEAERVLAEAEAELAAKEAKRKAGEIW